MNRLRRSQIKEVADALLEKREVVDWVCPVCLASYEPGRPRHPTSCPDCGRPLEKDDYYYKPTYDELLRAFRLIYATARSAADNLERGVDDVKYIGNTTQVDDLISVLTEVEWNYGPTFLNPTTRIR